MLNKIKMIMSNVCLSDVASECKYNGNCERHQDEALGKLIAEHDKQIKAEVIDEFVAYLHTSIRLDISEFANKYKEQKGGR